MVATSYSYDANGSLTSTGRWDYKYDAENRLVFAEDTINGSVVQFQYDGKGRRIVKLVDDSYSGNFVADKTYEFDVARLTVLTSTPLRSVISMRAMSLFRITSRLRAAM